jgi:hypothetical protein
MASSAIVHSQQPKVDKLVGWRIRKMVNEARTAGWNAQLNGIARQDNPYIAGSDAFRDWQEGYDQAGAQSPTPLEMRIPPDLGPP